MRVRVRIGLEISETVIIRSMRDGIRVAVSAWVLGSCTSAHAEFLPRKGWASMHNIITGAWNDWKSGYCVRTQQKNNCPCSTWKMPSPTRRR